MNNIHRLSDNFAICRGWWFFLPLVRRRASPGFFSSSGSQARFSRFAGRFVDGFFSSSSSQARFSLFAGTFSSGLRVFFLFCFFSWVSFFFFRFLCFFFPTSGFFFLGFFFSFVSCLCFFFPDFRFFSLFPFLSFTPCSFSFFFLSPPVLFPSLFVPHRFFSILYKIKI